MAENAVVHLQGEMSRMRGQVQELSPIRLQLERTISSAKTTQDDLKQAQTEVHRLQDAQNRTYPRNEVIIVICVKRCRHNDEPVTSQWQRVTIKVLFTVNQWWLFHPVFTVLTIFSIIHYHIFLLITDQPTTFSRLYHQQCPEKENESSAPKDNKIKR